MDNRERERSGITPSNVVAAAKFILTLDLAAIQVHAVRDSQIAIQWLQDCLDQYLYPYRTSKYSIDALEMQLIALLQATHHLLSYFTWEAQEQVFGFLQRLLLGEETSS